MSAIVLKSSRHRAGLGKEKGSVVLFLGENETKINEKQEGV